MKIVKTKVKKGKVFSKGLLITFSILIFFIAIISGGIWYWNAHKKAMIKNKMQTTVREKSNGLYRIKYDSLEMDEIAGNLSISNMNLTYDSAHYIDLVKLGKEPSILLNIHIPEISVVGVQTPRALISNEIVGRKLELKNPVINIIYTNAGNDSTPVVPQKELYAQILGELDLIQADTVLISSAQITTSSWRSKKTTIQIQDVSITLMNVKIDSISNADISRMLFAKDVNITCGKLTWPSADKFYNFSADSLSLSSARKYFFIKSFRLIPILNEDAFVKTLPIQDDRFDLSISNIQLRNLNMQQLFEQNLVADSMLIGDADFKIFCDLGIPHEKKNRVGTYPQQVIEKIPMPFRIGKIIMANGFIEYKEKSKINRESGKVQFYHVYADINNFTNDKKVIALNNVMTLDMSSSFLNKTPFKVNWLFYLLDPKGRFDLKGTVGPIDGKLLNSFAEPMGDISIKKGTINVAEFNLHGNDYNMDGSVKMLYQDLKVTMLKQDRRLNGKHKKPMLSLLANILLINSNPKKDEEPREAKVYLDRDLNHTIFNFSWLTVLKGIRETVGIKQ